MDRKITLTDRWPAPGAADVAESSTGAPARDAGNADVWPDPFQTQVPTLLVANKSDLDPDPREVAVLKELTGVRFPAIAVSARTGHALEQLAPWLFASLGIVRVYAKPPGHPPDRTRPFIVRRGDTLSDVARLVHQDVARSLKFARLWGSAAFDGQHVGPDHCVVDGDVVELHAN